MGHICFTHSPLLPSVSSHFVLCCVLSIVMLLALCASNDWYLCSHLSQKCGADPHNSTPNDLLSPCFSETLGDVTPTASQADL